MEGESRDQPRPPMPRRGTSGPDLPTMSFLEHLEELRKRLLRSVYAIAAAFALCLTYARKILDFFIDPIRSLPGKPQPVFLDLTEPFLLYMKVAFLASLFLSAPLVLYQVWRSEEHTSELQSLAYLVCRLLLEKKKHIMRIFVSISI